MLYIKYPNLWQNSLGYKCIITNIQNVLILAKSNNNDYKNFQHLACWLNRLIWDLSNINGYIGLEVNGFQKYIEIYKLVLML